jgi:phospholipid/cholesterol/gamma-HCH transport system substrate-binding protein
MINIVSSGKSGVALVPGQVVQGVESSMFDPIMEQVGLGPSERNHLQHTIAQIRDTVDQVAPRLRDSLTSLADTAAEVRGIVAEVRPKVQTVAGEIEEFAKNFDDASVGQTLGKIQHLATEADAVLAELRPVLTTLVQNVDGLTAEMRDMAVKNRPQIETLIAGVNQTRVKLDAVLANTEVLTGQASSMLVQNRADIERTVANVRDMTGDALKLVQKLYGNPFYLSPFYKPKPEDIMAQEMYDSARAFLSGAKEFHDALKKLEALQGKAMTKNERDAYNDLYKRAWNLTRQLDTMRTQFAQQIQNNTPTRR